MSSLVTSTGILPGHTEGDQALNYAQDNITESKADLRGPTPMPNGGRFVVANVTIGALDGRGARIDDVYFARSRYAIYASEGRILIQYSDDEDVADKQISTISGILPLRDKLDYLSRHLAQCSVPDCYKIQTAEALRLGLEGQCEAARITIQEAVSDITETLARIGRLVYLKYAALMLGFWYAALIVIDYVAIALGLGEPEMVNLFTLALCGGVTGAFLSIAIAIRARTVTIDGDNKSNATDAALRIAIGLISASVLYTILVSGILPEIKLGGFALNAQEMRWEAAFLVGIAAGFLERLVPDLLEKGKSLETHVDPTLSNAPKPRVA